MHEQYDSQTIIRRILTSEENEEDAKKKKQHPLLGGHTLTWF